MGKSLQEWLQEGEELYNTGMAEYRELESQLADLQERLAGKRAEVNQIARMTGKPTLDGAAPAPKAVPSPANGEPAVEVVEAGQAYTRSSIARALTGQPIRR